MFGGGRLAIENDRDTEGKREIQLKAAYQQAGLPAWVVPSARRLSALLQWWAAAWLGGRWLMTTDAGLQRDQWIEYYDGRVAARPLFWQASAAPLER
ncbi:MAG TPA: hypothetical protein VFS21_32690 [Roseiflexaceae bacterium]|nr:hypothetical protein [Roseiflexaceae bacterium]